MAIKLFPRHNHKESPASIVKTRVSLLAAGFLLLLIAVLLAASAAGCGDSTRSPENAGMADALVIFYSGGEKTGELNVEVARTSAEKARGLMNRDELDADSGMIFVYDKPTQGGFWMKDTYIPLSIAFIAANGAIVDIQNMKPLDQSNHMPKSPYIYAVEANQGWFAQHGVKVGDRAEFVED